MTPMTCWSALLTGLYRDYRELFTEFPVFTSNRVFPPTAASWLFTQIQTVEQEKTGKHSVDSWLSKLELLFSH